MMQKSIFESIAFESMQEDANYSPEENRVYTDLLKKFTADDGGRLPDIVALYEALSKANVSKDLEALYFGGFVKTGHQNMDEHSALAKAKLFLKCWVIIKKGKMKTLAFELKRPQVISDIDFSKIEPVGEGHKLNKAGAGSNQPGGKPSTAEFCFKRKGSVSNLDKTIDISSYSIRHPERSRSKRRSSLSRDPALEVSRLISAPSSSPRKPKVQLPVRTDESEAGFEAFVQQMTAYLRQEARGPLSLDWLQTRLGCPVFTQIADSTLALWREVGLQVDTNMLEVYRSF